MSHAMRTKGAIGTALVLLSLALVACGGGGARSGTVAGPSPRSDLKPPVNPAKVPIEGGREAPSPAPPCAPGPGRLAQRRRGARCRRSTPPSPSRPLPPRLPGRGTPRLEALDVGTARSAGRPPSGMPSESRRRSFRIPAHGDAAFRASLAENAYAAGECRPRTVADRVFLPRSQMARFVPFPRPERSSNVNAERAFSVGRLEEPTNAVGGRRRRRPDHPDPANGCPLPGLEVGGLARHRRLRQGPGRPLLTRLDMINLSGRPCVLAATPRRRGRRSGPPIAPPAEAGRDARRRPQPVDGPGRTTAAGGTAEFMLSIADPGDYGSGECG